MEYTSLRYRVHKWTGFAWISLHWMQRLSIDLHHCKKKITLGLSAKKSLNCTYCWTASRKTKKLNIKIQRFVRNRHSNGLANCCNCFEKRKKVGGVCLYREPEWSRLSWGDSEGHCKGLEFCNVYCVGGGNSPFWKNPRQLILEFPAPLCEFPAPLHSCLIELNLMHHTFHDENYTYGNWCIFYYI